MNIAKVMSTMSSAMLKKRVTFQKQVGAADAGGGEDIRWVDFYECWAYIANWGSQEEWKAGQLVTTNSPKLVVRWNPALQSNMNVKYFDGVITHNMRVESVTDYESLHVWMVIDCQEIEPDQVTVP